MFCFTNLVTLVLLEDSARSRIKHPDHLVLAGGQNLRATVVPDGAVDRVRMHADLGEYLGSSHIPNEQLVVTAGAEQDQIGAGMPVDDAHSALMRAQVSHGLAQILGQAAFRYLPDL